MKHSYGYEILNEFEYLDILHGKKEFIYVPRKYLLQKGDIIKLIEPKSNLELFVKITYVDYSITLGDFICVSIKEFKE